MLFTVYVSLRVCPLVTCLCVDFFPSFTCVHFSSRTVRHTHSFGCERRWITASYLSQIEKILNDDSNDVHAGSHKKQQIDSDPCRWDWKIWLSWFVRFQHYWVAFDHCYRWSNNISWFRWIYFAPTKSYWNDIRCLPSIEYMSPTRPRYLVHSARVTRVVR